MSVDIFGNFNSKMTHSRRSSGSGSELDYSYSDVINQGISRVENKDHLKSMTLIKLFSLAIFVVMLLRLFTLQVIEGKANERAALGNMIRPRVIEAARGNIFDKNGVWLARNQPSFALAITPAELPKSRDGRQEVYDKVGSAAALSPGEIKAEVEKSGLNSLSDVYLKENIPHDDALLLEQNLAGLSGVSVAKKSIRQYQSSNGLAHLLGYTGIVSPEDVKKDSTYISSDRTGKTGLESQYEDILRGKNGIEQVEKDSKGNIVRVLVGGDNSQPVAGDNIALNIDFGLQATTAAALQGGIDQGKKLTGNDVVSGTAIVMNVNTGAVLSMVSLPDYDDNLFAGKISNADYQKLSQDPNFPMFDRAIKGAYPPGSISKIILASAGLQEGTITKNTSLVTPPAIKIGDYTFPDWKDHSYETTTIERAIAESNNVFFYSVGGGFDKIKGLGIDKMKQYWQLFGLGDKTGIDLPGEASGLLPDPAWKQKNIGEPWYLGDTYHAAIGQGDLLVTPLQMLRATATIANGGKLMQPQLVSKVTDPSGKVVKEIAPVVQRDNFISSDNIKIVQEGMRLTVTDGSARNLNDLPFTVAGKTGTAQFENNQKTHAWFTCYAPYEKPEIAVIVLVEGGGEGYDIAAPVAKQIMSAYFQK